ncbi:ABC transporter permease [Cupriavidus pauculus]|jgi:lipopolysaccharide transport system permease protein|uniref:ABC transporter permease n=1 Tax=Cupriavidus pauculus TaxID=82633 RepID=UPI00124905B0|nr:ABC transporter permease [Cupriavidus pauculus]KAB0595052.1 ABC transporter permease [Cupriavidus pauculus]MCM3606468.1 ABC transporter permease [Cupriavidus pauculus]UAL00560.1 ABC transporter permease [Cupriavidus pauculus]
MSTADNVTYLESGRAAKDYWRDFWRHRELLMFLVWRDIIVRYKQTVVGTSWVLIRPFLTMLVFTFVFGKVANLASGNVPYSLVVFTGLLPWFFFASALSECSNSLVGNSHLISKIYFPRLIVPVGSITVSIVDFLITFVLLFLVMAWHRFMPGWHIVFVPLFILLAIAVSFGLGLWTAALNVRFRDFRHLIPFVLQLGVYVSPVGYSSQVLPEKWRLVYSLNPMVGVIDGFRWSILGGDFTMYWPGLIISIVMSVTLVATGIWYFRKTEATFADVI